MQEEGKYYSGDDLGAVYSSEKTVFKVWAPMAEAVELCLYREGDGDCLIKKLPMKIETEMEAGGVWCAEEKGNLDKVYYTYLITHEKGTAETCDPYAKAAGVNGRRSMVIDLKQTDPEGFSEDKGPVYENLTDIIVTEISVADTTADASANVKAAGKFLGLTETDTKTESGKATGFAHIKELGVTHVQIMPAYDFGSIDEAKTDVEQYNWGYDPVNYNVPEGSYSTDPFHGEVRIKEMKQMIQAFHKEGIGVIMDVVYNHTYNIEDSCFQKTAPDYFYRRTEDGYSDASACGNEVASEQQMVRKYIIDSLVYWAKEYHMDGFRFDLMGVLDIETMNLARKALEKVNPNIILYGEGWTGDVSTLPEEERALKCNVARLDGIGVFSDDIRDSIKGHVFYVKEKGFVNGAEDFEEQIRFCVAGSMPHGQVEADRQPYAAEPEDIVNYVSCHDNLTLWDKLTLSCPEASDEEKLAMNRLAAAIIFTSQGIPFFLQGEEFARTKPVEGSEEPAENSYNLPLFTNSLKYGELDVLEKAELYEFYKGLIAFRKAHAGLRLSTAEQVKEQICFYHRELKNVVCFTVDTEEETLFVAYNANPEKVTLTLPAAGEWKVEIFGKTAGTEELFKIKDQAEMDGISCLAAVCKK